MRNTLKRKVFYLCILFVLISFLYSFNVTTSRYVGQIEASEENIVAVPILTLSNDTMTYTIDNMMPGNEKTYEFVVSNYENDKINEVFLDYYFQIDIGKEIPLTVELYDITSGESKLNITDGKTDKIRMDYGTETSKRYKLKIMWNAKDNNYKYAGKTIKCNVILEAEQVI